MNNEKLLYDLIKKNLNEDGTFAATDKHIAKKIKKSVYSVAKYKKKLKVDGYVTTFKKWVNMHVVTVYSLTDKTL